MRMLKMKLHVQTLQDEVLSLPVSSVTTHGLGLHYRMADMTSTPSRLDKKSESATNQTLRSDRECLLCTRYNLKNVTYYLRSELTQ